MDELSWHGENCRKDFEEQMKLSIVIPVYNVEKYLADCLDSVLFHDIPDYEVIVVNDGSTDSSPKILKEYADRFPELLQVITTENGGVGSARNKGMEIAKGKYVLFLDSDDSYAEGAIPEILSQCDEDFDICFFDAAAKNESGKIIGRVIGPSVVGEFTMETNPAVIFVQPSTWNKIFRLSLFTDHGIFFPGSVWYEDLCTIPKLYIHTDKMIYVEKCWYNYMQRSGSIMNSRMKLERNLEIISACENLIAYYKSQGVFEQYYRELEYAVFYNELLCSIDRVNMADRSSPVQDRLLDWYLERFPDYKNNRYIAEMPWKYRLLFSLILRRKYGFLHVLVKLNDIRHR